MFSSQRRLAGIALALLLPLTAGGIYSWSANAQRASAEEPRDARVQALLRERLATLKDLATQTAAAYKGGTASFADVHAANEAVFRAELDLAESQRARIAIHEKLVAEAKQHEGHVAHLYQTGKAPSYLSLKARVHRLEAEIALEREKGKQPDEEKTKK